MRSHFLPTANGGLWGVTWASSQAATLALGRHLVGGPGPSGLDGGLQGTTSCTCAWCFSTAPPGCCVCRSCSCLDRRAGRSGCHGDREGEGRDSVEQKGVQPPCSCQRLHVSSLSSFLISNYVTHYVFQKEMCLGEKKWNLNFF